MRSSLAVHYEQKYASEREGTVLVEAVRETERPADRFEACVHFFPRGFRGSVLEVGAGDGRVSRSLLDREPGITSYVATEYAEARVVGLGRTLRDPRASVTQLDIESGAPAIGAVDAILLVAVVEHLIEPIAALRRLRALLRPGGFLYIDTPNIAKITRRVRLLLGQFPSTASREEGLVTYGGQPTDLHDEGHLHYFTYRSLSRILTERCGFGRVAWHGYHMGVPFLGSAVGTSLSRRWPTLFSELTITAHL